MESFFPTSGGYKIYDGMFALFVGINNYEYLGHLNLAEADAGDMYEAFRNRGFKEWDMKLLTNEEATKKGIEEGFDFLEEKSKENSLLIIFLAGHAVWIKKKKNKEEDKFFFCPQNFREDTCEETGIDFQYIYNRAENLGFKHTVFILDCCHSGGIFEVPQLQVFK